jgi:hypothetical protein
MTTKLEQFLAKEKIDRRRIVVASRQIEKLGDEDRAIRLARRKVRSGKPTDADKETAAKRSRSGKPVSIVTIEKALAGKPLTSHQKQRVTRAINRILTQKKKSEVTNADLF